MLRFLTEAQLPFACEVFEHVVDAGPHAQARQPDGSKVIASKHPLDVIDLVGSDALPPRDFVAVDVHQPGVDPLRVTGVVIRCNRKREYIEALPPALAPLATDRTVLVGDFNLPMVRPGPSKGRSQRLCTRRT
jgi:endonuclease/exonuclease/phosphatase family metal-dependent hydrolase